MMWSSPHRLSHIPQEDAPDESEPGACDGKMARRAGRLKSIETNERNNRLAR